MARDCKAPKTKSQGYRKLARSFTPRTKQVTTFPASLEPTDVTADTDSHDPWAYLLPDGEEGDVRLVQVPDRGSQPRCAPVVIGGVEAMGVIDTGADITIIGKRLFLAIMAARKLKKDCEVPDKTPRSYDRKLFTLQGMLRLETIQRPN